METARLNEIRQEFWAPIDALYEASMEHGGQPLGLSLFDAQVLAPLDWLAETSGLSRQAILELVEEGVLPRRKLENGGLGFTIFTEAQIRFMTQLRTSPGYPEEEIKHIIEYENELIENVFLEVTPYDDEDVSDLEDFKRRVAQEADEIAEQERIFQDRNLCHGSAEGDIEKQLQDMAVQRAQLEKVIRAFQNKSEEDLTDRQKQFYRKQLFRMRWLDEWLRLQDINRYEAQIRQGYSPEVMLMGYTITNGAEYEFRAPDWEATLRQYQCTRSRGRRFPLRTPDFTLSENGMTLGIGTTVERYSEIFNHYRLDKLGLLAGQIGMELWDPPNPAPGMVKCAGCSKIFELQNPKRKYCSEQCRQNTKHRRW